MKKKYLFIATITLWTTAFCACSKKGDPTTTNPNVPGMSGSINGIAFNRDSCIFIPYAADPTYVEIYATASSPKSPSDSFPRLDIEIHPYHGMGTYTMDADNTNVNMFTASSVELYSGIGTVTISQTSPNVVGTFSFTATNGVSVTNGSFTAVLK